VGNDAKTPLGSARQHKRISINSNLPTRERSRLRHDKIPLQPISPKTNNSAQSAGIIPKKLMTRDCCSTSLAGARQEDIEEDKRA
jgi:hypothetical protein